ncbi:MAG: hypothetical protein KJ964_09815 [Verrucomicrobia bacterium]|nr:hypothetical protein [Verrucomicrobiota bacterium]MBU1734256.1 hypothetical protein [Verrucomicrobiota bacterium]MBU1856708.1 hypothetical protein [Verrucomicrobiota bacterium]
MKPKALIILQACALAVFMAGVLAAITTIRQNLELRGKIRNKIETLAQLVAMKQTHDRHQAALRVFEGLSNAAPAALANLGRVIVTNATPEIRERESRNLTAGWTLRQMEVVFSEVDLNQVPGFLQAAEMQRPPWRLVECTLASSRQVDGVGRAVLILEAVGKGGSQTTDAGRQPARRLVRRSFSEGGSLGEGGTTDDGRQRSEIRGQRSEVRSRRPAISNPANAE